MIRKMILISLVCLLLLSCQSAFAADRYIFLSSQDTHDTFFDTLTIKFEKNSDGTINKSLIDVWIKMVYTDAGVRDRIKNRMKLNLPDIGWENLDFEMFHFHFNTKTNQYRHTGYASYDKKGHILVSSSYNGSWEDIIPNSNGEVCSIKIELYTVLYETDIENRSK